MKRQVEVRRMPNENMPSVDRLKLTVLVEDSVAKPNLAAKHGLSFLIETASAASKSRILMDAGPPPDVAVHNAHEMKEDIRRTPQV